MSQGVVAFLIGVLVLTRFPELPGALPLSLLCGAFLCALSLRHSRSAALTAWLIAGFGWAAVHGYWHLNDLLDPSLRGEKRLVSGQVVSLVSVKGDSIRFVLDPDTRTLPRRILVAWYQDRQQVRAGERWQLELKLKRPRGSVNPGGFDYEAWALGERLGALAYVVKHPENRRLRHATIQQPVLLFRSRLQDKINRALSDHPMRGLVAGLAIGARNAITPEQWRVLSATGTNHLVAISGLHVGVVAGFVFVCVRFLSALLFPGTTLSPTRVAILAASLAGLIYALLAGFSIPTRRALLMLLVVLGAGWFRRNLPATSGLSLALLVTLVMDPLAVLSTGFWLSYAAVGVIFLSFWGRTRASRRVSRFWQLLKVQWAVFAGLTPLTLLFFQRVSLVAPLINLILVPLFSVFIIPFCLLSVLSLELFPGGVEWPVRWCADFLSWLWSGLAYIAGFSGFVVVSPVLPLLVILTTSVGIVFLLLPTAWPGKWVGLALVMPAFVYQPMRPRPGEFELNVLDVGQGLSVVVVTAEHTLVYDTGNVYLTGTDAGKRVILPFLQSRGIKELDLLVLSHGDRDHTGGANSLMKDLNVKQVLLGNDPRLAEKFDDAQPCVAGQQWRYDGVLVEVLHPDPASGMTGNNGSCVLKISSHWGRALLTGDIEGVAEVSMLEQDLVSEVVLAPHHGSNTSSRLSWVRATQAQLVIFSASYANHWGFPKIPVVGRWRSIGAALYCTGTSGALRVGFNSSGTVTAVREQRRFEGRFWRDWGPMDSGCK